ncbi:Arc family DNA-binding protein [Caballeronia sp. dw_19]|uniref:Arc family DNA-binding protein n=1 Tax=Caballeronia sp. dw_19 TaxID=2719791 RepID=UPI001BCE5A8E|nr:Arc family DNA-binding protein [Caballeronia sp. dw_19]
METTERGKAFNLRIPPELRVWLEEEARSNMRSLNNEIVFKLSQAKLHAECDGKSPGQPPI